MMAAVPLNPVVRYFDTVYDTSKSNIPLLSANGGVFFGKGGSSGSDKSDYFAIDLASGSHDAGSGSLGNRGNLILNVDTGANKGLFIEYETIDYNTLNNSSFGILGGIRSASGKESINLSWASWQPSTPTDGALLIKITSDIYSLNASEYSISLTNNTSTSSAIDTSGGAGGGTGGTGGGTGGGAGGGSGSTGGGSGPTDLTIAASAFGSSNSIGEVQVGQSFLIDATAYRSGSKVDWFNWGWYLSTDPIIDRSDILLQASGSVFGPNLGEKINLPSGSSIPYFVTPGKYYVGALIDDNNIVYESNENNNASAGIPITVVASTGVVTGPGSYTHVDATAFGKITTDTHSVGGQVYALYDGILGRSPDKLGLEFYADQIEHGLAPASLAANFLASPEGQARLGAADNSTFVQQLYRNTLHRAADGDGLQYHINELARGVSRADVANNFVFSPEHLTNLQPTFDSGVFVPDAQAAQAARVYYTMLGRAPDAGGLAYWTDQLDHGGSPASIAQGFLNSPENQATYGKLSNSAYVDALYVNALGRHAEADGLSYWTDKLDHGTSRADLAVSLSQSPESQNLHLAQIEQGWHLA